MGKNSSSVSTFPLLFIFPHHIKQNNNLINIYKWFANKQIDVFFYIAENSYKNIKSLP